MRSDKAADAASSLAELEQALLRASQLETVNGARLVSNLSAALRESGRPQEAIEAAQRSLALMQKVLSPSHPDVAAAQNNLGNALSEQRRFDEAKTALNASIEIRERLYGPDAPLLATPIYNLGELARRTGNGQAALDHYRRSRVIVEKAGGPDQDDVWDAKMGEGLALGLLARHAEAEALLEDVLPQLEKRKMPAWNIAEAKLGLAAALRALRRDEKRAVELLTSVKNLQGERHLEQRRTAEALLAPNH